MLWHAINSCPYPSNCNVALLTNCRLYIYEQTFPVMYNNHNIAKTVIMVWLLIDDNMNPIPINKQT